jgi:DNA polymerase III subunit epsilon
MSPGRATVRTMSARPGSARAEQRSFEELGIPLDEVTFVCVDLETTGGSPPDSRITEVGAVKYRSGERVGTFQTLVDPGVPIPRFIT